MHSYIYTQNLIIFGAATHPTHTIPPCRGYRQGTPVSMVLRVPQWLHSKCTTHAPHVHLNLHKTSVCNTSHMPAQYAEAPGQGTLIGTVPLDQRGPPSECTTQAHVLRMGCGGEGAQQPSSPHSGRVSCVQQLLALGHGPAAPATAATHPPQLHKPPHHTPWRQTGCSVPRGSMHWQQLAVQRPLTLGCH